jgi:cytochrome P450
LPDPAFSEPLPPGPLGCPFRGFDIKASSPKFGPGIVYYQLFEKLNRPKVFKFFSKNKGIAIVSGYDNSKAVLSQEFESIASQVVPFTSKFVGTHSLRCCQDRKDHTTLRKLIGMATKPSRVSALIPSIQQTAEQLIDSIIGCRQSGDGACISMEDVCLKYTLEIACRHIIGLQDLPPIEVDFFLSQVKAWIGALYAKPGDTSWQKAREYLVEKIETKLESLEVHGPDDSTLSGMFFATDPDTPEQDCLTRDEIIDNTLLLILAGSETSAATLTNCILMLGLNKRSIEMSHVRKNPTVAGSKMETAWTTIISEQNEVQRQYGDHLNRQALDASVYLDGVVRESLRIKPIVGGSMRGTKSTIIVDGYQIPTGWGIAYDRYNTHLLDPVTFREDLSHMNVIQGFDPSRWHAMNENCTLHQPKNLTPGQEWIPFGIGPRYCLGADLAMVEMKLFLAVLARKMSNFELVHPHVDDLEQGKDILWRQHSIIPLPEEGVVIKAL